MPCIREVISNKTKKVNTCNHFVGIKSTFKQEVHIYSSDLPEINCASFLGFNYCPHCGEDLRKSISITLC